MKKVTIEITEKGYKIKVQIGNRKHEEIWEATDMGSKRVSGDLEKELQLSEQMYYALSGFSNFDVMLALQEEE